ncbi:hypothetical protein ACL02T_23545 [Pseudonocardia sp. RS010]|uniref:hypothetical protein n=1 Tax=Pseudonocardia sp. RS010 TaxID=3385979 RepID=UPI0039A3AFB5
MSDAEITATENTDTEPVTRSEAVRTRPAPAPARADAVGVAREPGRTRTTLRVPDETRCDGRDGERRRRAHRGGAVRAVAASVLGLAVVAGCSAQPAAPPSATPAPPATTSVPAPAAYPPELCTAAAQFQTAANALVQLDATKVGTDGVRAALQDLADAGRNLADAARAQFGPQVATLEQALDSLRNTIAGISDQATLSANLGALATSVAQVEAAARPIVDSVRAGCPGVPPTATPSS